MHLIAHRGWSMGNGEDWVENTLSAFNKSKNSQHITGIEIDIRRHPQTNEIVLHHDVIDDGVECLTLRKALQYAKKQNWQILIEFKEYDKNLFNEVLAQVAQFGLNEKCLLFGFYDVVKDFPFGNKIPTNLGLIVEYPWQIKSAVTECTPDIVLLGWDDRKWTQLAFRIWWGLFSLKKLSALLNVPFIIGVAESKDHLQWCAKRGVHACTIDLEKVQCSSK